MSQLKLWRQGEVITHERLNETVTGLMKVNKTLYNCEYADNDTNINSASTVPIFDENISLCKTVTSMWNADGEAIALDGWSTLSLDDPGIYARKNGVYFPVVSGSCVAQACASTPMDFQPDKMEYRNLKCELKRVDCDSLQIKANDVIWQKITINPSCAEQCKRFTTELEIHCEEWCAPFKRWSSTQGGCLYTPMSRIAVDCSNFEGCVSSPGWKAIAVNNTAIWPIPDMASTGKLTHADTCNIPYGDTQSIAAMPAYLECKCNKTKPIGTCAAQYVWPQTTLNNGGGLEFLALAKCHESCITEKMAKAPYIRSGVEFYGYEDTDNGAVLRSNYSINTCSPIPNFQPGIIGQWPIHEVKHSKCSDGETLETICRGALTLSTIKHAYNSWQVGFLSQGKIEYHVYPGESSPVSVSAFNCTANWTCVKTTTSGNTTIYEIDTRARVNSPLAVDGNGNIGVNIPALNNCLKPYYPILCEHACCDVRIRLCKSTKNGRDVYYPAIPQWVMDLKYQGGSDYCFDPAWFVVNGSNVTLNMTSIEALANEVANEIAVCVTATGIADTTEWGKIRVNTTGLIELTDEQYSACSVVSLG